MSKSGVRILVVDDELAIRRFLRVSLRAQGYNIFEAATAEEALQEVAMHRPDLVILDLGLPDQDGTEVVRELREWTQLPVIILSIRDQDSAKVAALDAGADDYLTKPFTLGELTARIRVALRHAAQGLTNERVFSTGDLTIDLARRLVKRSGQMVRLTPIEYNLLQVLVTHAGKVVTHHQLLQAVWGNREGKPHALRVHISNLRNQLETDPGRPHYILTEPGVGYRLCLDDEWLV